MSVEEFLAKQERVFNEIKNHGEIVRKGGEISGKTGLVSKVPQRGFEERAYIVFLGYEPSSCDRITQFCNNLENVLTTPPDESLSKQVMLSRRQKIIRYGPELRNIHSTLALYDKQQVSLLKPRPDYKNDFPEEKDETFVPEEIPYVGELKFDREIVSRLIDSVNASVWRTNKKFERFSPLFMSNFIHDEGTVLVMPMGEEFHREFYELREEVLDQASKRKIELNPGWGSHITVARIREDVPYGELREFTRLMEHNYSSSFTGFSALWDDIPAGIDYGIPPTRPETINVGIYRFNSNGFFLTSLSSLSLKLLP